MSNVSAPLASLDLWLRLESIHAAYTAAPVAAGPDLIPPVAESRELLRLFVQIGNDDLRRALIDLIRAMLDPVH